MYGSTIHTLAESRFPLLSSNALSGVFARMLKLNTLESLPAWGYAFTVFCYIEPVEPLASLFLAVEETREQYLERCRNIPLHLCRLRFFGDEERWSMAFYTYSNEKYEPSVFDNGTFHGTPEEAFETAAVYLQDE
jgi:hypothetical protein